MPAGKERQRPLYGGRGPLTVGRFEHRQVAGVTDTLTTPSKVSSPENAISPPVDCGPVASAASSKRPASGVTDRLIWFIFQPPGSELVSGNLDSTP